MKRYVFNKKIGLYVDSRCPSYLVNWPSNRCSSSPVFHSWPFFQPHSASELQSVLLSLWLFCLTGGGLVFCSCGSFKNIVKRGHPSVSTPSTVMLTVNMWMCTGGIFIIIDPLIVLYLEIVHTFC